MYKEYYNIVNTDTDMTIFSISGSDDKYRSLSEAMNSAKLNVVISFGKCLDISHKNDREIKELLNRIITGWYIYEDLEYDRGYESDDSFCSCGVPDPIMKYKNRYDVRDEKEGKMNISWEDMSELNEWIRGIDGSEKVWEEFIKRWYIVKDKRKDIEYIDRRKFEANKKAMIEMRKDGVKFPSYLEEFNKYKDEEIEGLEYRKYSLVMNNL